METLGPNQTFIANNMICISVHRMYSILYTYNMKYEYIDSQAGFQTGPSRGSKCASEIQISP